MPGNCQGSRPLSAGEAPKAGQAECYYVMEALTSCGCHKAHILSALPN